MRFANKLTFKTGVISLIFIFCLTITGNPTLVLAEESVQYKGKHNEGTIINNIDVSKMGYWDFSFEEGITEGYIIQENPIYGKYKLKEWVAPHSGEYLFEVYGASTPHKYNTYDFSIFGGKTIGVMWVEKNTDLYISVGEKGVRYGYERTFGGGGKASAGINGGASDASCWSGAGASDIRTGPSLGDRIMVAGGSSLQHGPSVLRDSVLMMGARGGGEIADNGSFYTNDIIPNYNNLKPALNFPEYLISPATGGTQTSGGIAYNDLVEGCDVGPYFSHQTIPATNGVLGQGGDGGYHPNIPATSYASGAQGSGGGGGYYGGAGSRTGGYVYGVPGYYTSYFAVGSGGGGSSYIDGDFYNTVNEKGISWSRELGYTDDFNGFVRITLLNHAPEISVSSFSNSYSEQNDHKKITINGTVIDEENDNITIEMEVKKSGMIVISDSQILQQCQNTKEFAFEITIDNTIAEGEYTIEVWADDGK